MAVRDGKNVMMQKRLRPIWIVAGLFFTIHSFAQENVSSKIQQLGVGFNWLSRDQLSFVEPDLSGNRKYTAMATRSRVFPGFSYQSKNNKGWFQEYSLLGLELSRTDDIGYLVSGIR